jgi:DNA-binding XRE family transcriptional regulator
VSDIDSTSVSSAVQPEYQIRDVPGFPGYRVDTFGQVWSNRHKYWRWNPYDPATPYRLLKSSRLSGGYRKLALQRNGRGSKVWVHRLVLTTFVGPNPPGTECRHLDGDPANNRLENLVWGTRVENQHDRKRHGTDHSGVRHYRALLTDVQVQEIRQRYAAGGITQAALGKVYGVDPRTVSKVVLGVTYITTDGPISATSTKIAKSSIRRKVKLTDEQVREIRQRAGQPGVLNKDLAAEYGVNRSTISLIRHNKYRQEVI